jgi:phospholipid transport system substrate-binding protein
MSRIAATLLLVVAITCGPSLAASKPSAVVDDMAGKALDILRDTELSSAQKRRHLEEVIYRNVDFETLSRLVLARNWSKLSDEQKSEFMEEFKKHLSATYGDSVDNYRNENIEIVGERAEKRGDMTVKSKIVRSGTEDILVDYRLRQSKGEWLIIDFIIEGVSLVANFRSQFQEIMSNGGADRLLELLREKNSKKEAADG